MASQFLFNDNVGEVVPFNAKFHFPDQATRTLRTTVKIPPKNGKSVYNPGDTIRFELPASGYLNAQTTLLSLKAFINAKMTGATPATASTTQKMNFNGRIQQNISSIFSRARLLYGSQTIEDIQAYGLLCRILTDAGVSKDYATSLGLMSNIGNVYERIAAMAAAGGQCTATGYVNDSVYSQFYPRGATITGRTDQVGGIEGVPVAASSFNPSLHGKRFVSPLNLGLFQQRKLIPLKWMASQLAIELTIDSNPANFLVFDGPTTSATLTSGVAASSSISGASVANSSYQIFGLSDLNLLCDIYEFDKSYDAAFRDGLMENGIPIQFSTWHYSSYSLAGTSSTAQIQERSRSVKLALACLTSTNINYTADSMVTFSCVNPAQHAGCINSTTATYGVANSYPKISGTGSTTVASGINSFQWRVGQRYFPAQPVEVHSAGVINDCPEGAEALLELQKALDLVGAYQTGALFSSQSWCNQWQQMATFNITETAAEGNLSRNVFCGNRDYNDPYRAGFYASGCGSSSTAAGISTIGAVNLYQICNVWDKLDASQAGSSFFAMAMDFETSNGLEISGVNAEEQSDIQLNIKNDGTPNGVQLNVFINVDAMLIVKEGNAVNLII